jgi:hypothetical protein
MKPTTRKKAENLNGNFGAARIQGKRDSLDLTKEILNKDNLRHSGKFSSVAKQPCNR